jgi:hypothetical protein
MNMPKSITDIIGNSVLNEDVKTDLVEAFEARMTEQRDEVTAELREEFASRYENDKTQIVSAMDALLKEALKVELDEFAQDKSKLAEDRVRTKRAIKEHSKMLDTFIKEMLAKEISELREDRKAQKTNFGKLEEFVLKQLTTELNEFHDDKRSLAEQKVKMVREGKKVIVEAKRNFVKKSAAKLEIVVESVLRKELKSLHEDIQTAKENEFGRKIFETFASEFMTSTLSESTQAGKLAKEVTNLKRTIAESNNTIVAKDKMLAEAKRTVRVTRDLSERQSAMGEMLGPLNKGQKELMKTLLESVKTSQLTAAYKKYLPSVLSEDTNVTGQSNKTRLAENTRGGNPLREVSGDKVNKSAQQEVGGSADIITLKKLAGLS